MTRMCVRTFSRFRHGPRWLKEWWTFRTIYNNGVSISSGHA